MYEAIRSMIDRYELKTRDDYTNALREIIQEVALLGLCSLEAVIILIILKDRVGNPK